MLRHSTSILACLLIAITLGAAGLYSVVLVQVVRATDESCTRLGGTINQYGECAKPPGPSGQCPDSPGPRFWAYEAGACILITEQNQERFAVAVGNDNDTNAGEVTP